MKLVLFSSALFAALLLFQSSVAAQPAHTPVPGGVGPVTVAILMRNSVVAAIRQKEHYEARFGTEPVGSQTQKLANSE